MSSCWVRCSSTTYTCDCTSPPPLLLQLRQVLPLIAPLLLGWFATLPGASAYRTDGCRIASHQATAFCASAPLIRLCKIEYTNIQTQFLFPKSQLPPKTLLSLWQRSVSSAAAPTAVSVPVPYDVFFPRCGPEEGGKSKWMVRSVPGKPVALVGPKSQFESQLWQQLTHHKCRLQYYLLLGQVLVMSDGKCKSNFVSHGIVTCGCHSGTDMKIGGRKFQRWIRAIFCLKYIPAIFRPFLFPP
jgi:hypothetical protein